ncbi:transcription elongation regulator, partial [Rhizopus stolonifer]
KKIPGTLWLFVLTPEGHEFYYDRETKTSVWEMPQELEEAMKELDSKKRKAEEGEEEESETKKAKVEDVEPTEMTEEDIMWQLEQMGGDDDEEEEEEEEEEGKEMEEEKEEEKEGKKERVVIKRSKVQEEPRQIEEEEEEESKKVEEKKDEGTYQEKVEKFYELLKERNTSPFAVYALEYPVLMTDPRFSAVPGNKQKLLFNKYCQDLGTRIKNEQKNKKRPEEEFMELLATKVTGKMYFDDFRRKYKNDPRFKAVPTTREREGLFKEYVKHQLTNPVEGYMRLLRETKEIQPGIRWRDVKKILEDDERYQAIESKDEREDLFRDYLETLEK